VSTVLVIAGSDSSGGAGLARDLCTLAHFSTAAVCALTAVTVQSDARVVSVHPLPPELVRAQIQAALATRPVGAIKIGMLASAAVACAVAASLPPRAQQPVVLDPVLAASSGGELLDAAGRAALRAELLPRTTLLTPNIPEAAALLDVRPALDESELLQQAQALLSLGPQAVLIKGGHGHGREAVDLLVQRGEPPRRYGAPRSPNSCRGTGCALASAIAAGLAAGLPLPESCLRARAYVLELLRTAA
jgi:hydroxymethylpyrimidine/phosphomethylpyrimidine kinase